MTKLQIKALKHNLPITILFALVVSLPVVLWNFIMPVIAYITLFVIGVAVSINNAVKNKPLYPSVARHRASLSYWYILLNLITTCTLLWIPIIYTLGFESRISQAICVLIVVDLIHDFWAVSYYRRNKEAIDKII